MRTVLIIGPGAIGITIAAALTRVRNGNGPSFKCGFFGRQGPVAVTAELELSSGREKLSFAAPDWDLAAAPPLALVFVAVKAFDLAAALKWTQKLATGTPIIPLSNGAVEDVVHAAAQLAPQLLWRLGLTTFGVSELGVRHYALKSTAGELAFGPLTQGPSAPSAGEKLLLAAAEHETFAWRWHPDITLLHRRKWLFNTVMNTLTAAKRLPRNEALLADLVTLAAVFNEAYRLGAERFGPWQQPKAELYAALLKLIERTAANENSMARDVRLGRPTEKAFLAGDALDFYRYPLLGGLQRQI